MKSAVFCRKAGEKCFSWTATHSCYKNYAEKKNRRTFAASKVYNQHSNSPTRLQPLPSRLDARIRCLRHTIVLYAIEFAPCVSSHPLSRKCHFRVHRNSNLSHRMCCKVSSFFRVLSSKRYQCLGQPQHHAPRHSNCTTLVSELITEGKILFLSRETLLENDWFSSRLAAVKKLTLP